jgi:hypothetical protein
MMAKLKEIVIDCDVPSRVARFWADALDDYQLRPYDEAEIARLAGLGLTPETDPVVMVDGPSLTICFHKRGGPRHDRNRLHFDIEAIDRVREVARLISLGASFLRETEQYTVLRDPEGNQFCVVSVQRH